MDGTWSPFPGQRPGGGILARGRVGGEVPWEPRGPLKPLLCPRRADGFVRRKKKAAAASATGGKKRSKYSKDYTEGWVEFRDKRVAKRVAASLHNTPMGARRRSPFRYDLWNLKVRGGLVCLPSPSRGCSLTSRWPHSLSSPLPSCHALPTSFLIFVVVVVAVHSTCTVSRGPTSANILPLSARYAGSA